MKVFLKVILLFGLGVQVLFRDNRTELPKTVVIIMVLGEPLRISG